MTAATSARASSRISFALCPIEYRLDGLPYCSSIQSSMASIAARLIFVVAALSA